MLIASLLSSGLHYRKSKFDLMCLRLGPIFLELLISRDTVTLASASVSTDDSVVNSLSLRMSLWCKLLRMMPPLRPNAGGDYDNVGRSTLYMLNGSSRGVEDEMTSSELKS